MRAQAGIFVSVHENKTVTKSVQLKGLPLIQMVWADRKMRVWLSRVREISWRSLWIKGRRDPHLSFILFFCHHKFSIYGGAKWFIIIIRMLFFWLRTTFLLRAEGEQQLLLLVHALQEGFLLRVAALPENFQLVSGLLMLLPQPPLLCVALSHFLAQPAQLGLVGFMRRVQGKWKMCTLKLLFWVGLCVGDTGGHLLYYIVSYRDTFHDKNLDL